MKIKNKNIIGILLIYVVIIFRKILNMPTFSNAIYLKDEKNKIILESSPKVGSVIWTKMFFDNLGILDEALQYSPWIHDYRIKVYAPRHLIRVSDFFNQDYIKIKVVRNPYARVVSSYLHVIKHIKDPVFLNVDMTSQLLNKNAVKSVEDISFKQFVDFLFNVDMNALDSHVAVQYKWYERFFKYDYVCKLEDTEKEVKKINKKFNINFKYIFDSEHHISKDEKKERMFQVYLGKL